MDKHKYQVCILETIYDAETQEIRQGERVFVTVAHSASDAAFQVETWTKRNGSGNVAAVYVRPFDDDVPTMREIARNVAGVLEITNG